MITIKAIDKRDYFRLYMGIRAINGTFNAREIQVAAEFLWYRDIYLVTPIEREVVTTSESGEEIIQLEPLSMMEQLKDARTLIGITTQLNMSFPVFRINVQSLKDKGFFTSGNISARYTPPKGNKVTFKVIHEAEA